MCSVRIPNWKKLRGDQAFRGRMEARRRIIRAMRAFFDSRGFTEVETPIVVPHPGMEPNLSPIHVSVSDETGQSFPAGLITSPEYQMKKLLAAGYERIYEISRAFRNEEPWSGTHTPEFTMIEWYRTLADYRAMMNDTEQMVAEVTVAVLGTSKVAFAGHEIELSGQWERISVSDAFEKYAHIDLGMGIEDHERFRREVEARGCPLAAGDGFEDAFFKIFLRDIEPSLGFRRPVILYDYPASMASLARLKKGDPRYAERFEAYCAGMELGNAFSELNDAVEQRTRLEHEQLQRREVGKCDFGIDEQFLEAVRMMPESAGIAFGVDRLVMLLTDTPDIRDVLFFPASDLFRSEP